MKVVVGNSISNLYRKIVDYHEDFEVRDYTALTVDKKEEVLAETFERRFKAFWNSFQRSTCFKKEVQEEEKAKIEKRSFLVTTKAKSSFTALFCFYFDIYNDVFEIEISNVAAETPEIEQEYMKFLNKELAEIKTCLEEEYTERRFVKDFFNTLHVHRLSLVTGNEAVLMFDIYRRAKRYYPDFRDMPYWQQMRVMHEGYLRGRVRAYSAHDIYGMAKATFEQLDKEGLIGKLDNGVLKELVYERRITRRAPEFPFEIWQRDYLVYATYEYKASTGEKIRISYHPSELWLYLTQL